MKIKLEEWITLLMRICAYQSDVAQNLKINIMALCTAELATQLKCVM